MAETGAATDGVSGQVDEASGVSKYDEWRLIVEQMLAECRDNVKATPGEHGKTLLVAITQMAMTSVGLAVNIDIAESLATLVQVERTRYGQCL